MYWGFHSHHSEELRCNVYRGAKHRGRYCSSIPRNDDYVITITHPKGGGQPHCSTENDCPPLDKKEMLAQDFTNKSRCVMIITHYLFKGWCVMIITHHLFKGRCVMIITHYLFKGWCVMIITHYLLLIKLFVLINPGV